MNRFYVPEHCSTQLRVLGITFQLRWINAGTISKEVKLIDIQVISRFITLLIGLGMFVYGDVFENSIFDYPQ